MTGGEVPRKRGRPKGSGNKRSKDLAGYIGAKFGGSAAQQMAAACMVTPAEVREAGGSVAKAQVAKALDLVKFVRDARGRLDDELRQMVREALEDLLAAHGAAAEASSRRELVAGFISRVRHLGGDFGLSQALELLAKERAALLPYTDKRQPQAIEATVDGMGPAVVFQVGQATGQLMPTDAEFVEVFEQAPALVSPPMSHEDSQATERADLFGPSAAD